MKKFTSIPIAIFDPADHLNTKYILPITKDWSPLCITIRKNPEVKAACLKCDYVYIKKVIKTSKTIKYICHAGLIDFLVPIPTQLKNKVDLAYLLADLGFIHEFVGEGYTKLVHPELAIKFLVPERGRGSDKPFNLSAIGVNAQQVRYLDLLSRHVIRVNKEGFTVVLPHPALFAFHKLIIASLRKKQSKTDKDIQEAIRTINELLSKDGSGVIYRYFQILLPSWRKKILKKIEEIGENEILVILKNKGGR